MFAYAKSHEPCIIFMDEIDAIGGKRFNQGRRFISGYYQFVTSCSQNKIRSRPIRQHHDFLVIPLQYLWTQQRPMIDCRTGPRRPL